MAVYLSGGFLAVEPPDCIAGCVHIDRVFASPVYPPTTAIHSDTADLALLHGSYCQNVPARSHRLSVCHKSSEKARPG